MEKSIQIAYKLGKTAHNGQKRTGSNSPYFQHCKNVFKIVSSLKNKEDINLTDMQIMALLHDTIEDTQVTREEIEKIFGFKIADGVWALTKNNERELICNVMDANIFHPCSKYNSRQRLGILPNEKVLLFGAAKLNDPIKGADMLFSAI